MNDFPYKHPVADRGLAPPREAPQGYPSHELGDVAGLMVPPDAFHGPRQQSLASPPPRRLLPWDPVVVTPPDDPSPRYQLHQPVILSPDSLRNVDAAPLGVSYQGGGFQPAAGQWVVAEAFKPSGSSPYAFEIKQVASWDGHPAAYEFSAGPDFDFVAVRFPLWKFEADSNPAGPTGTRIRLGAGANTVLGQRLVPAGPLRLYLSLFTVPSTVHHRLVPVLV